MNINMPNIALIREN